MSKKIAFIGQAPARPGAKHGEAGTYVKNWLHQIGLSDEGIAQYCRFYALVGSFPGSGTHGHLRPTPAQVLEHRPVLINLIKDFQPDIMVLVGAMAIAEALPVAKGKLSDIVGNAYEVDPFESMGKIIITIPLPHPSGRSTWLRAHRDKLETALQLLKRHLS
jgi:uracil-DNA glycosylase